MNRFDKYVGTDYVPIPFQELLAAGERQQKSYDVADTLKAEAIGFLDDMRVVKGDEPVWNAYREKAKAEMDKIVKDYETHKDNSKLLRDTKIWANRAARNPIVALNQTRVKQLDDRFTEYSKNPGAYVKSPYEQSLKPGVVLDPQTGGYTSTQDYNIQNEPWLDYLEARDAAVKPINDAVYDMGINPRQLNFGKDGTVTVMEEGSGNRVDFRKTKALQEKVNQAMNTFGSLPAGQQFMKYATPGNEFGFASPEEFIKSAFTPKVNMQRQVIQNSFKDGAGGNRQPFPDYNPQSNPDTIDPLELSDNTLVANTLFSTVGSGMKFDERGNPIIKKPDEVLPEQAMVGVTNDNASIDRDKYAEFVKAAHAYRKQYPFMKGGKGKNGKETPQWTNQQVYNYVLEAEKQKQQLTGNMYTLPGVNQEALVGDLLGSNIANNEARVIVYKRNGSRREPVTDISTIGEFKKSAGLTNLDNKQLSKKVFESNYFVPYKENPVPGKAPIKGALKMAVQGDDGENYEIYVRASNNSEALSTEVADFADALRKGPGEHGDFVVQADHQEGAPILNVFKKERNPEDIERIGRAMPDRIGRDSKGLFVIKTSSDAGQLATNTYISRFLTPYMQESKAKNASDN